jgi:hypothetical protein
MALTQTQQSKLMVLANVQDIEIRTAPAVACSPSDRQNLTSSSAGRCTTSWGIINMLAKKRKTTFHHL